MSMHNPIVSRRQVHEFGFQQDSSLKEMLDHFDQLMVVKLLATSVSYFYLSSYQILDGDNGGSKLDRFIDNSGINRDDDMIGNKNGITSLRL